MDGPVVREYIILHRHRAVGADIDPPAKITGEILPDNFDALMVNVPSPTLSVPTFA